MFQVYQGYGIVVNGYARVSQLAGTTVTVANVNEVNDSFEDGEYVIIMQMQDNVIGSFTTNVATFGSLSSIGSAGLYEVVQIQSHTETGGIPTTITFASALGNSYNIGSNSSVQIITFPTLGSPNYNLSSVINPITWNGNIGGVIAFNVSGVLSINNNIDASGYGFRGGAKNLGTAGGCNSTTYMANTGANFGLKGEGIYRINTGVNPNFTSARAKILNGGGGGNSHNSGGGGGSNCSTGGDGGPGADLPFCTPAAGGQGGISLSTYINAGRVFMGGGGGSGEGNEGNATGGGNGGGIILVKANTISTSGICGGYNISANGTSITFPSFADGSGGGGGGGSIVLEVNNWVISPTCQLNLNANGGDGGNVQSPFVHGGGGGGGTGVVLHSTNLPVGVNLNTNPGNGGKNDDPTTFYAANGSTITCNTLSSGPLPIELLSFEAFKKGSSVLLEWVTATELNNDFFEIHHSMNAIDFTVINMQDGVGTSTQQMKYDYIHTSPLEGTNYYRLRQVDFDGKYSLSPIRAVKFNTSNPEVKIWPNPADHTLKIESDERLDRIEIFNDIGQLILEKGLETNSLEVSHLADGVYILRIDNKNYKLIINHNP
ncbi:MAG: T9SS type A sorting domain-containing protein [Bacteroidetes bacterium]|nr:T9SS type A sorting domain-containing protein [Bacteroidota bacterium]